MKDQIQLLLTSSQELLNQFAKAIPLILGALLILIIGWLIAKLIKRLFIKFLKLIKFNNITEKAGIDSFLKEGGVKVSAIKIMGSLVYWIVMLVVIMAVLNSLKLTTAVLIFNKLVMYIPNIIVSIVILLLGIYAARFVSKAVRVSLNNVQEKTASLLEKITYYAIVCVTVFIVLSQLNIGENILNVIFISLFGALCLAAALAFGLGGRRYVEKLLDNIDKNKKK